jgi:hypothetical protein
VLNIAPVDDVGYVADNIHAYKSMKAQGISSLGEAAFLRFSNSCSWSPAPGRKAATTNRGALRAGKQRHRQSCVSAVRKTWMIPRTPRHGAAIAAWAHTITSASRPLPTATRLRCPQMFESLPRKSRGPA